MYLSFYLKICIFYMIISRNRIYAKERGTYLGCYTKVNDLRSFLNNIKNLDQCIDVCKMNFMRYAVLDKELCFCTNDMLLKNELNINNCNTLCNWSTINYCGGENAQSYYDTDLNVAGPPKNIRLGNQTETSISIQWTPPTLNDLYDQSIVRAVILKTYTNDMPMQTPQWIIQKNEQKITLLNLQPGTTYNITITSSNNNIEGGTDWFVASTLIDIPDPEPQLPSIVQRTSNTVVIDIPPPINNNGPVTFCRVVVIFIDNGITQNIDETYLTDFKRAQDEGINFYIAAELDLQNRTKRFTVGDGLSYRGYNNAPLPANFQVKIVLGIVSTVNGITKIRYAGLHTGGGSSSSSPSNEQNKINAIEDNGDTDNDGQILITILIVACCIFGVLLIVSVIGYCYLRIKSDARLQRLPSDHHELSLQGPIIEVENNGYIPDELSKGNFEHKLNQTLQRINVNRKYPRNALTLDIDNVIGNGNFGDVIRGILHVNDSESINCHVHVISDDMEPLNQSQFLKEFDQLLTIESHSNILKFLGYSQTPDWLFLIFNDEDGTCTLKKKLIESRIPPNIDANRFSSISEEKILLIICELSDAFKYLSGEKFVHKKLCSYNIRLTQQNKIKISAFGGTPLDDYGKSIDLSRWNAPEVLKFQHYSIKSDVWSFGCLMWECCCLGGTLYANINTGDLLARIKNGVRCEQPSFIYDDIYQLFLYCWELDPHERPTFTDISLSLRQFLMSPLHVLSFSRHEGITLPYYMPLLEAQLS